MTKIINKISPSCAISLLILIGIIFSILQQTDWHFTYSLDDPYIHLKLAQNIALGHYGINLSEYSAPSSSILWPFLLVPFAFFDTIFEYIPLIINIICALLSVIILDKFFAYVPTVKRIFLIISIMIICNIYGIVFTGLEHSLQILCVVFITYCLFYLLNLDNKNTRILLFLSLFLLPLVRYEGLALSLPILFYFYKQGYKKQAFMCLIAIICFVCGFSLFLYTHGLGYLPASVVAKTGLIANSKQIWGASIFNNTLTNIKDNFSLFIISLLLFFHFLKPNLSLSLVILSSSLLHLIFGKFGWFGRYEVYQVIFIMMIACRVLSLKGNKFHICIFFLLCISLKLFICVFYTPLASSNIYHQQVQMARVTQMLDDKVAVNDIGLVSLRSKHEILDVYGLASIQALKIRLQNPDNSKWINILLNKNNIKFIMIYDDWFPRRPSDWIKIATLYLNQPSITPASNSVSLYAIDKISADKMLRVLQKYSKENSSDYHAIRFVENKDL